MNCSMATRRPTRTLSEKRGMIDLSDVNLVGRCSRSLCVAPQTKIWVALNEHLVINRPVRRVTHHATVAHSLVFKNERSRLLTMALCATFVDSRHGQPSGGFHDVKSVRIMALNTIHVTFDDTVVIGHLKFGVCLEVALKTGRGVLSRIDNEVAFACLRMQAPGAVTEFASGFNF